jgi:hypothetical protein
MRAAELVRRADQHVGAGLPDVDRLVRRVVDGVDPRERAGLVREPAHPLGVHDRADRVRRPCERDHPGARPELALQIPEIERRVVVQPDVPDDQAGVVRELQPRGDAAVMVERGDQDLVAGAEPPGGGPRQHEVQRGHVRPEDHLMGLAAEEPRRVALGVGEDLPHAPARRVARAEVGARLAQRPRDRVADLVGHLGAARGVEERETLQGREAVPDGGDVDARAEYFGHRQLPLAQGTRADPQIAIESQHVLRADADPGGGLAARRRG